MATKFLDPGGDATFTSNLFMTYISGATLSSSVVHGTHLRSSQMPSAVGFGGQVEAVGALADAGRRVSAYFLFDTIPNGNLKMNPIEIDAGTTTCFGITITTTGNIAIYDKNNTIQATGSTVLSVNNWYRISLVYTITSSNVNSISVYLNGMLEVSVTNITVTINSTNLFFGFTETAYGATGVNLYVSDIYVDDQSSGDPGNIWVTAKRPFANGALNQFTTQIGSGGSGYGTGHSPQVNERPLNANNGWSIQNASKKTEEYSIEGLSVGDFNLTGSDIIDFMGWIYAKVGSASTGNIILTGNATNISLTTSYGLFKKIAGLTTYPAGNTDIGMDTNTINQLFSLAECGIIIAFIPQVDTFADLIANLVTSAYKWLTQALLTAQQQFTVRPYFTAQIIDDTIQPKAQLFSNTSPITGNGTMAIAPDGTAFSVGLDSSNNLNVYRATNLDATAGVFPNSTTIDTTGSGSGYFDSRNIYSIKISNYYNGSYRICVWYFTNLSQSDGTNIKITLQYSDDGGLTFTKKVFTPSSFLNNITPTSLGAGNLSLSGFQPVFNSQGLMKMGCFYIKPNTNAFNSDFKGYDLYYIYGDITNGFTTDVIWGRDINSYDWTIHSLASYYFNNRHYCVFSGFRNFIDTPGINLNYSLWSTYLINLTSSVSTDLWESPISVMPIASASVTNPNKFIYPWATVVNNLVYIIAQADLIDSMSQSSQGTNANIIATHINYILLNSDDGEGFSYPSILVGTDGTEFNSGGIASFILQNGFWWLGGSNRWLWELQQNNIVADVSQDIIGYTISDVTGQASSVNLQIANANNKWIGASPTGQGASAITKNKKICIWQGYYNPDGTTGAVPHSTYYIDDINQTVTGTQNDITLIGRDLYKKLTTTVSKFSYQYNGPIIINDIFDGSTMNNWNQASGGWKFNDTSGNGLPSLRLVSSPGEIFLTGSNLNSYGHVMRLSFVATGTGNVWFYGFYIDSNNYFKIELDLQFYTQTSSLYMNGVNVYSAEQSMPFHLTTGFWYNIYFRKYDYFKFNVMISDGAADTLGNSINNYYPFISSQSLDNGNTGNAEYDFTSFFANVGGAYGSYLQEPYTVGFGADNDIGFEFFSISTFAKQLNLGILLRKIARISGIFSFYIKYMWRELIFLSTDFTGTFTILNRILNITAGNQAIQTVNSMSDGEVSFMAKCTISNPSNPAGLKFAFRYGNSGNDTYYFHVIQTATGLTFSRFERLYSTNVYKFYNTVYDVNNSPQTFGSLNIDLTQWNVYKIIMINGSFYAYINDIMVASFTDNNTTVNYLTSGNWGFLADSNTTLQVQKILAPQLWKPVQTFSINSGDDMLSDTTSLAQTLLAWFFSDLLSRFKAILLSSSDASTYTYNTQLYQQNSDNSDKEYISQVTVYGNGVSATARNTNLMAGVIVREEVVVDYTILTQDDAQVRANNELTNANQYQNQYTPKQIINVGAELFDAITIVNIGNNTSGVNGTTRTYAETFTQGGGSNNSDYSIELDSGNL